MLTFQKWLWDNKNNGSIATKDINNSLTDTIGSSIGHRNIIRNMGMHMGIDQKIPILNIKGCLIKVKDIWVCKGVDEMSQQLWTI